MTREPTREDEDMEDRTMTTHLDDGRVVMLRDGDPSDVWDVTHAEGCAVCTAELDEARARATIIADALFALGEEANALALLMSREVAAHGQQQQGLLELALTRTSALGVDITWSSGHQRYFYDGAAFRRYLELAPESPDAVFIRKMIE